MKINWSDVDEIAYQLEEKYPEVDNVNIAFTELQSMIMKLSGFQGTVEQCNEKILEAIQQEWINVRNE